MDFLGEKHYFPPTETDTTISIGALSGVLDTTTLAAHDFDVDTRTGFLPPQAPLARLPSAWEEWEAILGDAILARLQLGDKPDLQQLEKDKSRAWRDRVRKV
jgi:indoleamine 2,3-dioxygenase